MRITHMDNRITMSRVRRVHKAVLVLLAAYQEYKVGDNHLYPANKFLIRVEAESVAINQASLNTQAV